MLARFALVLLVGCSKPEAKPAPAPQAPPPAAVVPPEPEAPPPVIAEDAPAVCATLVKVDFPAADKPSSADRGLYGEGDAHLLYYGIGRPVDYVKARHAAFTELKSGDRLVFGGRAVLMMLYANGRGVQQNLELAARLACEYEGAPAEIEGRVQHVRGMGRHSKPFDICDDYTSGFMEGHCRSLEEEKRSVNRELAITALVSKWPTEHRDAFARLREAERAFVALHGAELDLSGTARAAIIIEEEAKMADALLDALERFERGKLPRYGKADSERSERALNDTYQRVLKKDFSGTTIEPESIRAAERKWLPYRDAWLAFAALHYPQADAHAWRTWLNEARTAQLANI